MMKAALIDLTGSSTVEENQPLSLEGDDLAPQRVEARITVHVLDDSDDDNDGNGTSSAYIEEIEMQQRASKRRRASPAVSVSSGKGKGNKRRRTESEIFIEKLKQDDLDKLRYPCGICLCDDIELKDMVTLSCNHRFCSSCFVGHCKVKISEARVSRDELVCPGIGCTEPITIHELKAWMDEDDVEKFHRFSLKFYAKSSADAKICPKCGEWFIEVQHCDEANKVEWKRIQCGKCGHAFCGACGQQPHNEGAQRMTCEEFAESLARNATDETEREALLLASLKQSGELHAKCPQKSCGAMCQLIQGCKFGTCGICRKHFCFICGCKLTKAEHHSHFSGQHGPFGQTCKNKTKLQK